MFPKYIHYCWFSKRKKPLFFKKIKKSWEKYLPNFKVIEWNEENFNINFCKFINQAYKEKKFAFVADVARFFALKKFGGIYLDIDMEITKNIDFLFDKSFFIGSENNIHISGGIIGVKNKNNPHISKIIDIYKKMDFSKKNIWDITLPKILTNYFEKLGYKKNFSEIQVINKEIYIFPREYFYPLSYTYENNQFTKNTVAVHHFYSSWTSLEEKTALFFVRIKLSFLVKYVYRLFNLLRRLKIYHD